MPSEKLILTIVPHSKFGYILQPIFASIDKFADLYEFIELARKNSIGFSDLNEPEKQVILLSEKYTDFALMKSYSREKNARDFLQKVTQESIDNYIRPFIEARHREIIKLAKSQSIPIYTRDQVKNRNFHFHRNIEFFPENSRMLFQFSNAETFTYKTVVRNGDEIVQLFEQNHYTLCSSPAIILIDNKLHEFSDVDEKKLLPFFTKNHIEVPQRSIPEYIQKFVVKCVKEYDVIADGFDVSEAHYQPKAILNLETSIKGAPALHLKFQYGRKSFEIDRPYKKEVEWMDGEKLPAVKYFYRDEKWEKKCILLLENSGLERNSSYHFTVNSPNSDAENPYGIVEWINQNQEILNHFQLKQDIQKHRFFTGEINLTMDVSRHQDWFDIRCIAFFDESEIPFSNFRTQILNNVREYILPDGSIAVLPLEWFSRYSELFRFGKSAGKKIRLKPYHFRVLELAEMGSIEEKDESKKSDLTIPKSLNATLRPYQMDGFQWLVSLQNQNFGGCLADDMGLGKTLQTITLLLYNYPESRSSHTFNPKNSENKNLEKGESVQLSLFDKTPENIPENTQLSDGKTAPPSLIVMPTSLTFNWLKELQKFAPTLCVYVHTGMDRASSKKFEKKISNCDIILTTYGTMRQDIDFLSNYHFHYIVLDESQHIKNPTSQTFQCAKQLQSNFKLVLTGTPVENSLSDLWAQMDFLNDGILGSLSGFQKRFKEADVISIDKTKDALLKIINPFILRRLKEEVVKELPPLTEEIRYCEMSEKQAKIYRDEKNKARNALLEQTFESGIEKPTSVSALTALTKLRLLANHPVISIPEYSGGSGKFEEIIELADTLISEGHKVLIFSSFVKHLRLVADYFDTQNRKYAWLTGSTTNREREIERFNQNNDISVFFISLKAGGTGLNLTTADYVFILDPWWNPAAEMQAVSRAHRIGQDKKVTLYRFITRDTVEEKINLLQQNKSELSQAVVSGTMSVEEMMEILKVP